MFWSVTYDGKPLDTTKHTYNQAFAIYALSSYYDTTGNEEALEIAKGLQKIIEENAPMNSDIWKPSTGISSRKRTTSFPRTV